MRKTALFCILFLMVSSLKAQNLVPNPSFEVYDTCPNSTGEISYAVGWFQPNTLFSFSHYCNKCCPNTIVGVPHNQVGYQNAHTGNGYAILGMYWRADTGHSIEREYIEVKLIDSLKKNNKYNVSFYVSLGDSCIWATNNIQCYFSKNKVQETNNDLKCLCSCIPQITCDSVITDTANWVNINGSFIAQGGEQYLTIGNFYPDSLTKKDSLNMKSYQNGTGYYIDDVSVTEDTTTGINELANANEVKVYPNPSNGIFTFTFSHPELVSGSQITVYNELGLKVYDNVIPKQVRNDHQINLTTEPAGIYFYRLISNKGEVLSSGNLIKE